MGRLVASDTSSPVTSLFLVFIGEVSLGGRDKGSEFLLVLLLDVLNGKDGGGLLVDDGTEPGLVLDNDVWDTHLAAQGWEEDDQLDWVYVVSNDNEVGLLCLNEGNDMVKTVLDEVWLLGILILCRFICSDGGSSSSKTGFLLLLGLWSVLVEELEELGSGVLVKGMRELSNRWWDLQSLVQDDLLALEANVLGPLDESGEIARWLDLLANGEVLWTGLKERILLGLGRLGGAERCGGRLSSGSGFSFRLVIESDNEKESGI